MKIIQIMSTSPVDNRSTYSEGEIFGLGNDGCVYRLDQAGGENSDRFIWTKLRILNNPSSEK